MPGAPLDVAHPPQPPSPSLRPLLQETLDRGDKGGAPSQEQAERIERAIDERASAIKGGVVPAEPPGRRQAVTFSKVRMLLTLLSSAVAAVMRPSSLAWRRRSLVASTWSASRRT